MIPDSPDVLVIGAGPAGLSAAQVLAKRGVGKVLVVDRETAPGGMPRYCPHATFGLPDYLRPMSGPAYAARLAACVDPAVISTGTTVTSISPDLVVAVSSREGEAELRPGRILFATGIRETPRAARLVSGDRPLNVLTTGALQRIVAMTHRLPFKHPLVVGTELVSFSAVLTLRDCGVRPVAMIESAERIQTLRPADLLPRLLFGVPVLTSLRVLSINAAGEDSSRLRSVTLIAPSGATSEMPCDAVIFTGRFVPEASLLSTLPSDLMDAGSRGPAVDQMWRLAEPRLFAAGNVLRSVETASWSAREGAAAAHAIADELEGRSARPERRLPVLAADPVKLVIPSAIAVPGPRPGPLQMTLRIARSAVGRLTLVVDGRTIWHSRPFAAHPERRLHVTRDLPDLSNAQSLTVGFEEKAR